MKKAASANPLGNNGQVCSFCAAFSSLSSGFLAHGGVTQRHFGSRFPKNRHPTLTFLALIDLVSNISKQLLRTTSRHSWRLVGENCVGLRIEKDTSYPPRTPLPELNACNNFAHQMAKYIDAKLMVVDMMFQVCPSVLFFVDTRFWEQICVEIEI